MISSRILSVRLAWSPPLCATRMRTSHRGAGVEDAVVGDGEGHLLDHSHPLAEPRELVGGFAATLVVLARALREC